MASNGLCRKQIPPDGNCFFNAIIHQTGAGSSVSEIRARLCSHLQDNEEHYIGYMTKLQNIDGENKSQSYQNLVEQLQHDGIWDTDMSDVLPLATANLLGKHITIYTSRLNCPIINISPDIGEQPKADKDGLKIAYLAVSGYEHYDSCVQSGNATKASCLKSRDEKESPKKKQHNGENTPTKTLYTVSDKCVTPRKGANYVSPKKITRSRKKTLNFQRWKKTIRKTKRNSGQSYVSDTTKKVMTAKTVLPATCKCKFKCLQNVSEDVRKQINESYYEATMTFERKRDFICHHIDVAGTTKRFGRKRKKQSRKFYLPVNNKRVRVCKSFFLKTLNIGKKVIEWTLKRKRQGNFDGTDMRGKHAPANKTNDHAVLYIKRHIESFP